MSPQRHFHEELSNLERDVLAMGDTAERQVEKAVRALMEHDLTLSLDVIAGDDEIDRLYLQVDRNWLELLALQAPVAIDLRLMAALSHLNTTLERMGDQAVNIAKITKVTADLPTDATILRNLQEMGDIVRPMIRTALHAFASRNLEEALRLPEMDDRADRLNREMYRAVVACADDQDLLEWATRMMVVSRALERVGDQSVDIGEQVAFLLTGDFREFT